MASTLRSTGNFFVVWFNYLQLNNLERVRSHRASHCGRLPIVLPAPNLEPLLAWPPPPPAPSLLSELLGPPGGQMGLGVHLSV